MRCSARLGSFDAVVAGECYATTPRLFELLTELFRLGLRVGLGLGLGLGNPNPSPNPNPNAVIRERASTSLADAMSELADRGSPCPSPLP